jgi:hypothetical protein
MKNKLPIEIFEKISITSDSDILFPSDLLISNNLDEIYEILDLSVLGLNTTSSIKFKIDVEKYNYHKAPFILVDKFIDTLELIYNKFAKDHNKIYISIYVNGKEVNKADIMAIRLVEAFVYQKGSFSGSIGLCLSGDIKDKDILMQYLNSLDETEYLIYNNSLKISVNESPEKFI